MRTIKLDTFGIIVELDEGGGRIISPQLKEACPYCSKDECCFNCEGSQDAAIEDRKETETEARERLEKNRAFDGIETLILSAACAGVDIESPAFQQAIEEAVEAVDNNV